MNDALHKTRPATTSSRVRNSGQGMVEYIIVGALIAVATIAVYSSWAKTARLQSSNLALEIAGKKADMGAVKKAADAAGGRANDPLKAGLGRYNYANDAKK